MTPVVTQVLTVNSVNPASLVAVTVSPSDNGGAGNGSTSFTRTYNQGTVVTLTAPATAQGNTFSKWQKNGVDYSATAQTTVTMDGAHTMTAVYTVTAQAPQNVPEAANYTLVYSLDLPNQANYNTTGVPYQLDNHSSIGTFSRVGYYLELQPNGGALQYVWVSMDAFTTDVTKIGVPAAQTGAFFQRAVANMNVRSSVAGIVTGDGLTGGNLEFWPSDYNASNSAGVPNASGTLYDWGDSAHPTDGYASMQIHNSSSRQTLFAFNGWGGHVGYVAEIGIGN